MIRRSPLKYATIPEAFEACVLAWPDAVAVVCDGREVSYGELNRRANRLAHHLIAQGVQPDTTVAICVERSIEMVVGQLGILKAGGIYVPLDADFPRERLEFMLADTAPIVVLTQRHLREALPESADRAVIALDDPAPTWVDQSDENPDVALESDHLAYIIYTSGSTGRAKGVALTQRGVVRLVTEQDYAPFHPGERFLAIASPSFDAIIFELWGPLLNGACCVLMADRWPEVAPLGRLIRDQGVTCAFLTTGLFNQIIDHQPEVLAPLRTLLIGGEEHSPHHTRRALERLPGTVLVNGYGPTECTTFACTYRIGPPEAWGGETVPIGIPVNNTTAVIVDETMQVVPAGQSGELCLGGLGLAREYWRRPELTAERFGVHTLPDHSQERLYRTGDICRWRPNGNIEFLGRRDDQIKLRGFRIEPGEIEGVLRQFPGVGDAVVFVREHAEGRQLAAAMVGEPNRSPPDLTALRPWLRARLPDYLVPVSLTVLSDFPLTANGKVDRRALSRESSPVRSGARANPEPDDPMERRLLQVWRRVLGDETVGPQDDFFARGGDSMACMELALEIGRILRQPVSVAWVHQAPTVAAMARKCAAQLAEKAEGSAADVPFSLFQLPGLHGGSKAQARLALGLSDRWRSYDTLVYPGAENNGGELSRIDDFAADIVAQIRRIRPNGPYALCGFSFGALVAFEAARQLTESGQTVTKLVLWDPGLIKEMKTETGSQILGKVWGKLSRKVRATLSPGGWRDAFRLSSLTREQLRQPVRWILPRRRAIQMLSRQPNWSGDFVATALRAFEAYRLPQYDGDVVLMQCWREEGHYAPVDAWRSAITGKLTMHRFPCPHDDMLREPMMASVIEATRHELEKE